MAQGLPSTEGVCILGINSLANVSLAARAAHGMDSVDLLDIADSAVNSGRHS